MIFFSAKEELDSESASEPEREELLLLEDKSETESIRSAQVFSARQLLQYLLDTFEPLDSSKTTLTVGFVSTSVW